MSSTPDGKVIDDYAILGHRGPRNQVDPYLAYAAFVEPELTAAGNIEDVATIFITNRECTYRCLMCDLWKNTTEEPVPEGAVPAQIRNALASLPPAQHIKLYNAGSFFDRRAIPAEDYQAIASLVAPFRSVIVEAHPRLVTRRSIAAGLNVSPQLQVAMGLETVDPDVLPRLNKQMTLEDFDNAVARLGDAGIAARAFVLIKAPFQSERQGVIWAKASIDHAFEAGVECCCVIPTRSGNGIMEWLTVNKYFSPPTIQSVEAVHEYGIGLDRGRVFVDLWDIGKLMDCARCREPRIQRLERMNFSQKIEPPVECACNQP